MKDETGGTNILEHVAPYTKVYAQKYVGEITKKSKGLKYCIIKFFKVILIM